MNTLDIAISVSALLPVSLMLIALLISRVYRKGTDHLWKQFIRICSLAFFFTLLTLLLSFDKLSLIPFSGWLTLSLFSAVVSLLVQFLGMLIAIFSARYLEGEENQQGFIRALSGVLASVQLLILADHWIVLIVAWTLVGLSLQPLLCFYPQRPFARLAAHKKRLADRIADLMLIFAAATAWISVGSGSFTDLHTHVEEYGLSLALHLSAIFLVIGVVLRTALLPVHGWLIQVMEAPTPVSALLHAGVINLGGFVLIRFAPLLEHAFVARWILVIVGLGTALLAGLIMLTRVSIKVRLAWSTLAQMGFMILELGLGLYTLAALHLIGHSIYKAHAFLSASSMVRDTRLAMMHGQYKVQYASLWLAPLIAAVSVQLLLMLTGIDWPWWWTLILAFAWSPLLWTYTRETTVFKNIIREVLSGVGMMLGLSLLAIMAHALPLGLNDSPVDLMGSVALIGMALMYLLLVMLQVKPESVAVWRRSVYAGFYLDEYFTRLTLRLWPTNWGATAWPQQESSASEKTLHRSKLKGEA